MRPQPDDDTTVTVSAELGDAHVGIVVADDGPGIREDVFAPFVRAGDSPGSTGLSLAVVQAVVAAHGGHVEMDTCEHGTRSTLLVPWVAVGPDDGRLPEDDDAVLDASDIAHVGAADSPDGPVGARPEPRPTPPPAPAPAPPPAPRLAPGSQGRQCEEPTVVINGRAREPTRRTRVWWVQPTTTTEVDDGCRTDMAGGVGRQRRDQHRPGWRPLARPTRVPAEPIVLKVVQSTTLDTPAPTASTPSVEPAPGPIMVPPEVVEIGPDDESPAPSIASPDDDDDDDDGDD